MGVADGEPLFGFGLTETTQLSDQRRVFNLSSDDIARMNPNTRTAIVISTRGDAEVLRGLYKTAPVLIQGEGRSERPSSNINIVLNQFSSSNAHDRTLFERTTNREVADREEMVPVIRGSLVHQFEHRFGTFDLNTGTIRQLSAEERGNPDFRIISDKYVPRIELERKLSRQNWTRNWPIGWRDQVRASDVRTMIAAAVPLWAADDSFSLLLCHEPPQYAAALLANLNSLCVDFVVQRKITTFHLRKHVLAQLPVLPPQNYSDDDFAFIVPRVLELSYTSHAMAPFARDLGYDGPPFAWDEDRRALLRAELDAFYARAYGLTRTGRDHRLAVAGKRVA
jgi:hypothetical protein